MKKHLLLIIFALFTITKALSQVPLNRPLQVIESRTSVLTRPIPANTVVWIIDEQKLVKCDAGIASGVAFNSVALTDAEAKAENYRGYYTSVLALSTAIPTGTDGDFAVVNPGGDQNIAIYAWESDNTTPQWVPVGSASTTGGTTPGRFDLSSFSVTNLNDVSSAGSGQIITAAERTSFTNHVSNTSNPHTVTLEQARTAGANVSGNIGMSSNKITGLATPTDPNDAANKSYVDNVITNIDWKQSVLDVNLDAPPVSPAAGNRYLVSIGAAAATGDWATQDNSFAVYNGTTWDFTLPELGDVVVDEEAINTDERAYIYNGTSWVRFTGGATTHNSLNGLQGGTTDEYFHLTQAEHTAVGNLATVATTGSYNDLIDQPSIPGTEAIEDVIGAMVTGNTETGITVTYDDVNGKLNFVVSSTFQGPAISNFRFRDLSNTVDAGTTLSGNQVIEYNVSNQANVQGNLTLTQGATAISTSIDPAQTTATVSILSVTLTNAGDQVTWTLSGTDVSNATFSATYTITALAAHEFFYILESTSNNPASVDINTPDGQDDKIEITTSGQTGTFSVGPTVNGEFIILLVPFDHDLTSLINTGINQNVLNLYTRTANVRLIAGVQYISYVFGPVNPGLTINYRYTLN